MVRNTPIRGGNLIEQGIGEKRRDPSSNYQRLESFIEFAALPSYRELTNLAGCKKV